MSLAKQMKQKAFRGMAALFLAAVLLLADRLAKLAAAGVIREKGVISLIPGVLSLTYVENTGAAFGLFAGGTMVLFVLTAILLILLVFAYIRLLDSDYLFLRVLTVFAVSGGIGNMFDRLLYGYVIDMIWFTPINFPVFNLADCYITVCAFLLIILLFTRYKDEDFSWIFRRKEKE